ncbi:AAA family ATPase [Sneathiella chungangensis]|uniref:DNA 3'-5' helicase n=1 Tax=Sneathiella chungangensis TaxID=1418234 RepID=A0A845MEH3_9PROT|nr:UvrD-helicase domain-containing protein [Sneathiella chungangensis]MZR22022.1 AAA family ATPase [Sneathiella chungangensis]
MEDRFDIGSFDETGATSAPADFGYLDGLNDGQRAAVEALDGPVLVLAGAGTGKTRVLISRLAHILNLRNVRPWEILAVTFTNKAAAEMQERTANIIGPQAVEIKLGTFHSIGVWLLRRHAELIGIDRNFTILDTDDQLRLLKQIMTEEGIDQKRWPPRGLAAIIDRWKDKGLRADQVQGANSSDFAHGKAAALYALYQERLSAQNACDFGDLLLHVLTLFQRNPDILSLYQNRFKYILVDEYQDTNVAQYLLLRLLAQTHRNICCVGDDDQSIYGWRGAEVGNILKFEDDFPGARVIRLERNYRSTSHILGAASGLIAHNESRLGKTLFTEGNDGELVVLNGLWDGQNEARWIADEIENMQRKGKSLQDMAILVRASFQTRDFEECFLSMGIKYRVIGGLRFYERREIRDVLAYLRVINQPEDDLAFERIYNLPKRGLGEKALEKLREVGRAENLSLSRAAKLAVEKGLFKGKPLAALKDLMTCFDDWRAQKDLIPPDELVEAVLEDSGYFEMWRQDKSLEAEGKRENLKELIPAVGEYESLAQFLEHVSLVMENNADNSSDMVSLMTLHSAKGLEYDVVFLPGWEEGLFPHQRALDENGLKALEEERRLAYVGITRAKERCYISHASNRRIHGQWQSSLPSRFIDELPREHIADQSEQGLYNTTRRSEGFSHTSWRNPDSSHLAEVLDNRARANEKLIDNSTKPVVKAADEDGLAVGSRIFHQKFGYGRIVRKDGPKLEIAFEKAGVKKVMENFVQAA